MDEQNKVRVGYIDAERKELIASCNELRAHQHKLMRELAELKVRQNRLSEINSQQIAICVNFIEEVGDDAEARHYLEQFLHNLYETRKQIESLQQEVRKL